jgi:hypothetical protein
MVNTRKLLKEQLLKSAKDGIVSAQTIKDAFAASGGDPEKIFKTLELDAEAYNVKEFVEWLHAPEVKKLVIYSSRTPDKADFKECLKCPGLEYDWETATAETLIKMIADAKDKMTDDEGFDCIAFACHGPPAPAGETRYWAITKSAVLTSSMTDDLGDVGEVLAAFAEATKRGGRVDLLACNLLKDKFGQDVLRMLETRTATNFAASSNVTGNPKNGGDWIMESDGINVGPIYFKNLEAFEGTFQYCSCCETVPRSHMRPRPAMKNLIMDYPSPGSVAL